MKALWRWIFVIAYTIGIFVVTPYLPQLIRAASSKWSSFGVSRFVLWVEIGLAVLILGLAIVFIVQKKRKSAFFLISAAGIFLLSLCIYQLIPNPYEFTHLPEYAVLSVLLYWALNNMRKSIEEIKGPGRPRIFMNTYFQSGAITGMVGSADEIYQLYLPNRAYTWYDIFLNILGGILGLLIIWGIKRQK